MVKPVSKSSVSTPAPVEVATTTSDMSTAVNVVEPKQKKAKKAKKDEEVLASVPVEVASVVKSVDDVAVSSEAVAELPLDEVVPSENNAKVLIAKLHLIEQNIITLQQGLQVLKVEYRQVQKFALKEAKVLDKYYSKGKKKSNKTHNTGIHKPTIITPELSAFLQIDPEQMYLRKDITKLLAQYIRTNGLGQGKAINPNADLVKLLNYNAETDKPLNYFNLQHFLKHHFHSNKNNLLGDAGVPVSVSV